MIFHVKFVHLLLSWKKLPLLFPFFCLVFPHLTKKEIWFHFFLRIWCFKHSAICIEFDFIYLMFTGLVNSLILFLFIYFFIRFFFDCCCKLAVALLILFSERTNLISKIYRFALDYAHAQNSVYSMWRAATVRK